MQHAQVSRNISSSVGPCLDRAQCCSIYSSGGRIRIDQLKHNLYTSWLPCGLGFVWYHVTPYWGCSSSRIATRYSFGLKKRWMYLYFEVLLTSLRFLTPKIRYSSSPRNSALRYRMYRNKPRLQEPKSVKTTAMATAAATSTSRTWTGAGPSRSILSFDNYDCGR